MIPGMNPRKVQQMMKQMGIQQQDIDALEVIIKTSEKTIIITNPSVAKVNMMGQETFQISGEIHEQSIDTTPEINEDDIQTVMEQAGVNQEKAKEALDKSEGDLAQAIMSLKDEQ
jgi:nascent polypeptide-associated complex subunit alpha